MSWAQWEGESFNLEKKRFQALESLTRVLVMVEEESFHVIELGLSLYPRVQSLVHKKICLEALHF